MTIADPLLDHCLRSAEVYMNGAIRPGTRANHMAALRTFIGFSVFYKLEYTAPTVPHACAFIDYLISHYSNPGTIANYVSSLTSVLRRLHVDVTCFASIEVNDLMTSVKTNIRHLPNKKAPVAIDMLPVIIYNVLQDPNGSTVAFAITTMFFTFLRQSNLGPRNKTKFDATRHLLRRDVHLFPDGVLYNIKWSKTRQASSPTTVAAPAMPGHIACPAAAYTRMIHLVPTVDPAQPLLCFADRSPMPISYIDKVWDAALQAMGIPSRIYTLHSLRRGGATEVYGGGVASLHDIQQHGTWQSRAVYEYLPNDPRRSTVFKYFRDIPTNS